MSDVIGLVCIVAIFGAGVVVGYLAALVRLRGRPRLVFPRIEADNESDIDAA